MDPAADLVVFEGAGPVIRRELGVIAEDLQAAFTAASRPQQRGVKVQVVRERDEPISDDAQVLVVDLDARSDPARVVTEAQQWTAWLRSVGCVRIDQRIDTLLRGDAQATFAGVTAGCGMADPLVLAMPAYPSAGRVCIDGTMQVPSAVGDTTSYDVATQLFGDVPSGGVTLEQLAGGTSAILARLETLMGEGVRHVVFDATTEGHLAAAGAAVAALEQRTDVLTVSSGAWLRYHPALDSEGFVLVVSAGTDELDRVQLGRVADMYGPNAIVTNAGDVLADSDAHLKRMIATHRIVVVRSADGDERAATAIAADLASAAGRVIDLSTQTKNVPLGVITSGGVTTGAVIRALGVTGLRPGNELEPLCPVVRLDGSPIPNLALISKASGIGSPDSIVRLIRRLIGS